MAVGGAAPMEWRMFDRYDPRSNDGRDRGDPWDRIPASRGGVGERDQNEHSRDVFTRDLDLPRGRGREQARDRERVYEIDGAESRALATIGAFRVVAKNDFTTSATTHRAHAEALSISRTKG